MKSVKLGSRNFYNSVTNIFLPVVKLMIVVLGLEGGPASLCASIIKGKKKRSYYFADLHFGFVKNYL
jgi:hypothetical protein